MEIMFQPIEKCICIKKCPSEIRDLTCKQTLTCYSSCRDKNIPALTGRPPVVTREHGHPRREERNQRG